MQRVALLLLGLLVFQALAESPVVTEELVQKINSMPGITWRAGADTKHAKWTHAAVKRLLGALPAKTKLPEKHWSAPVPNDLPAEFDPRKEWGAQCPSLNELRDQGDCGSCWAFAAAEAITDRICIATKGKSNKWVSTTELVGCCSASHAPLECIGDQGCNGGQVQDPWRYWHSKGLVSGGLYGDMGTCQPYICKPCEHHTTGSRPQCSDVPCSTPKCPHTCVNSTISWDKDKEYGDAAYSVSGEQRIMQELMTNGPLSCAFDVYEDFEAYKGGVYQHKTGKFLGGHAVKMMGWGVENGTPYWLIANSWNDDWGENGFFRILRGKDECGIEDDIAGGIPK